MPIRPIGAASSPSKTEFWKDFARKLSFQWFVQFLHLRNRNGVSQADAFQNGVLERE